MSAKQETAKAEHKTKKFGKSERSIPHHTQKAKKFYPAEDEAKPKKVREAVLMQWKWVFVHIVAFWYCGKWLARNIGLNDFTTTSRIQPLVSALGTIC